MTIEMRIVIMDALNNDLKLLFKIYNTVLNFIFECFKICLMVTMVIIFKINHPLTYQPLFLVVNEILQFIVTTINF